MSQTIILYAVLLTAVLFDFWKCKIPNFLIIVGYFLGLLCCIATDSLWYFCITDSLLLLLILYPLFLLGAFGGGDIKLLTVISLFIGFEAAFRAALLAIFIGAVFSVFKIIWYIANQKEFRFSSLYVHFSLPIFSGVFIIQTFGGSLLWEIF